jgi:hypothetical protein
VRVVKIALSLLLRRHCLGVFAVAAWFILSLTTLGSCVAQPNDAQVCVCPLSASRSEGYCQFNGLRFSSGHRECGVDELEGRFCISFQRRSRA